MDHRFVARAKDGGSEFDRCACPWVSDDERYIGNLGKGGESRFQNLIVSVSLPHTTTTKNILDRSELFPVWPETESEISLRLLVCVCVKGDFLPHVGYFFRQSFLSDGVSVGQQQEAAV